jgi:outer membrane protein OmpA-like peptidoglycan-associated protein
VGDEVNGDERIGKILYFPPAETVPVRSGYEVLADTGALLRAEPDLSVTLRGYTAPYSTEGIQRVIAELRVRFCAGYLMKEYGIEEERMRLEWYGGDREPEAGDGCGQGRDCVEVSIEQPHMTDPAGTGGEAGVYE